MGAPLLGPAELLAEVVSRRSAAAALWFHQEGVELPVNKARGGKTGIAWQLPTQSFVGEVIRNPFYAGAYGFGRRPTETNLVGDVW